QARPRHARTTTASTTWWATSMSGRTTAASAAGTISTRSSMARAASIGRPRTRAPTTTTRRAFAAARTQGRQQPTTPECLPARYKQPRFTCLIPFSSTVYIGLHVSCGRAEALGGVERGTGGCERFSGYAVGAPTKEGAGSTEGTISTDGTATTVAGTSS